MRDWEVPFAQVIMPCGRSINLFDSFLQYLFCLDVVPFVHLFDGLPYRFHSQNAIVLFIHNEIRLEKEGIIQLNEGFACIRGS